ncbi:hypothetical protein B0H17DRAFT_1062245 [Mycena rosella]|uniref:Uncharacterized protein n=1 Tax=Mycena rosella TaxID=1033263 RepID=A0AAD7DKY6_MYCRO|nr:hypothetical protein B0H17DRAFT_1062245 [Mycena rosella]
MRAEFDDQPCELGRKRGVGEFNPGMGGEHESAQLELHAGWTILQYGEGIGELGIENVDVLEPSKLIPRQAFQRPRWPGEGDFSQARRDRKNLYGSARHGYLQIILVDGPGDVDALQERKVPMCGGQRRKEREVHAEQRCLPTAAMPDKQIKQMAIYHNIVRCSDSDLQRCARAAVQNELHQRKHFAGPKHHIDVDHPPKHRGPQGLHTPMRAHMGDLQEVAANEPVDLGERSGLRFRPVGVGWGIER